MTTTKKRINISIRSDVDTALSALAERDNMPVATKAEHLLSIALEIEEDIALDAIADAREGDRKKFISHAEAWK